MIQNVALPFAWLTSVVQFLNGTQGMNVPRSVFLD